MDAHKQLSQMDPKLKEAYERVMGNSAPTPQPAVSQPVTGTPPPATPSINSGSPTPQSPQANGITHIGDFMAAAPAKPILQTVEITTPETHTEQAPLHPTSPQEAVASEKVAITNPHPAAQTYVAPQAAQPHTAAGTVHIGYGTKPGQKVNIEKKKLNIPPALYIVGCIVFFILYTFF